MVFNSIDFMIFFPLVLAVYFVIPKKTRYIWLLVTSYYFYMSWNPKYAVLIGLSTVITYVSGIWLGEIVKKNPENTKKKKFVVAGSFVTNLGILFFFKYFDFALSGLNILLNRFGVALIEKPFDLLLPVGISFYTFQALSYTMDVYRGDIEPERNVFKYALFVSFFPQLVAGPIERSTRLMKQVQHVHTFKLWNYERVTSGAVMMLWGYFMKMVIADRLAIFVDGVFDHYTEYGTVMLMLAAVFFAFQIYCDFGSYSMIAAGCAKVMGFELMENFNTPYFARSIKEFWRRWHISLSTWFRDYLYIPLGGSRKGKGRKYLNLLITFLVSGLWHGASMSFVVWGGLHGLYQMVGDLISPLKKDIADKIGVKKDSFSHKLLQCIITFVLVDVAWIFFRSNTLGDAVSYISRMVTKFDPWTVFMGGIFEAGLTPLEFGVAVVALFILFGVDLIRYKKNMLLDQYLNTQSMWLRWSVYLFLTVAIFVFGVYGPVYDATQFIYFQF